MKDYPPSYDYSGVGQKEFTTTIPPYVLGGGTLAFDDTNLVIDSPIFVSPFAPDIKDSMAQSWHLTVERQLFSRTALRLSYAGTKGSNLQISDPINTAAPASTMPGVSTQNRRANPVYGDIGRSTSLGYSSSHQFQAEVRRDVSRGLTLGVFYALNRSVSTSDSVSASAAVAILGDRESGIVSQADRIRLEKASSSNYPIHQFTFGFPLGFAFWTQRAVGHQQQPCHIANHRRMADGRGGIDAFGTIHVLRDQEHNEMAGGRSESPEGSTDSGEVF